jgi:hypothetical protein
MRRLALLLMIAGTSVPAFAQTVTLTEKSGRPLTVGVSSFAAGLRPATVSAETVVEEFRRLCLPDPLAANANAASSSFGLQARDVTFPATKKRGDVQLPHWRSDFATLTVWTEGADLNGEPIAINERGYQTTGAYGPFRADGDQCNLVVMMPSFTEAKKIGELLVAAFGPAGKFVVKNSFADGHWTQGNAKINFTTPSTKAGSQPVHLSVQISKKGSRP